MQLKIKRLCKNAKIPTYATEGSACFDIYALDQAIDWWPANKIAKYRTGIAVEVPEGHAMLIFSRSGHGFNDGIRLSNCVGVIDSDYRGEIAVKLKGDESSLPYFKHGERIAQGMIVYAPKVDFIEADLSETDRGAGGFGSTGK